MLHRDFCCVSLCACNSVVKNVNWIMVISLNLVNPGFDLVSGERNADGIMLFCNVII